MVAASLLGFYLLLLFIANATPARHYLADVISSYLREKLCTNVKIESVELGLFNRLTLKNVSIEDQRRAPLLKAKVISAKIEIRSIFLKRLNLRTISLIEANANLYKEKRDKPANFQFIIDAFKSKEKKKKSPLNFRIGSLIIRRSQVKYDELYKPVTPGVINLAHVDVSNINANVSLKSLTDDSLNIRVRSFAFKEKSGLDLKTLRFRLAAGKKKCEIRDFTLELPGSKFYEESLNISYDTRHKDSFLNTITLKGSLNQAIISLPDWAFVLPQLKFIDNSFYITLKFNITPLSINIPIISVKEKNDMFILSGKTKILRAQGKITEVLARINDMHADNALIKSVLKATSKKRKIPRILESIPNVDFDGSMKLARGGTSFAQGTLSSSAGNMYASLHWNGSSYSINASTNKFNPANFFSDQSLPDDLSFLLDSRIELQGKNIRNGNISTIINSINYKGHVYRNIKANASLTNDGSIALNADVKDPLISFRTDGVATLQHEKLTNSQITLSLFSFNPHSLGLTPKFQGKTFVANIKANISSLGKTIPDMELQVSDFLMKSSDGGDYSVDNMHFKSTTSQKVKRLSLKSDFLDIEAQGTDNLESLKSSFNNLLSESIPALPLKRKQVIGSWTLWANLHDSKFFNDVLDLPLRTEGNVQLNGHIQSMGRSSITCIGEKLGWGGIAVKDFKLYAESFNKNARMVVQGAIGRDYGIGFSVEANSNPDGITSQILWKDILSSNFNGEIRSKTFFSCIGDGKIDARMQLLPTSINIGDTVWNVVPGVAEMRGKEIMVRGIGLTHDNQSLKLFGNLSNLRSDSIIAELKDIDIAYILGLANLKPVSFGGLATGRVSLSKDNAGKLQAGASLTIPEFKFNEGDMGHSLIKGVWRQSDGRLWLSARMNDDAAGAETDVDGYVGIAEKRLDLNVRSINTNLHFLRRYISSIFPGISGRASGNCRIYGPFKELDFEGSETASIDLLIPATGARYSLSDVSVAMSPGLFTFSGGSVSDAYNGQGQIDGRLSHLHLKNVHYDFRVNATRLLLYDHMEDSDMPFTTRAFGNGTARLHGQPGIFTADINITPSPGTVFNYRLSSPESYDDLKFLTIRPRTTVIGSDHPDSLVRNVWGKDSSAKETDKVDDEEGTTDIRLNMQIAMNPNVPINIIMDQRTGDALTAYGSGTIRANFYNKTGFQMFGTYEVDRGQYHVSLQNLIRKDFRIDSGGRITFSGSPTEAALNLKAIYTVPSASLSDLGLATLQMSTPVRVNCILNISGSAGSPQVSFDLDLPTVSEDIKQMVRQTISTDEDMNMQIIYLLGIGRFYTYDSGTTRPSEVSTQSRGEVAVNSFLSTTLSSQLNDIISSALGRGSNWTLGTNLTTGEMGWSDMEVGGLLSGRLLNNRLLINGNFGYKDKTINGNNTNFIGDFDINYLINPKGTISLKAYSETNDRYFSKSSLTTQGIGIKLQKDFTELRQLFTPKKKKVQKGRKREKLSR